MHPGQPFLGLDITLTGSDADLLSYSCDRPGPKEFSRNARGEDFLSQEVEKTELLRSADGHHACLQLLFEQGVSGRRLGKVEVSHVGEKRLILDHEVLLAGDGISHPPASDSDLRPGFRSPKNVLVQLICCKCDA